MKQILFSVALAAAVAAPVSATAKAPIEGRWKNGKMEIQISPCGRALCGTVVKASAKQQAKAERGSGTDLLGARLIKNIQPAGQNAYRANVFVADRNIHARGTIKQLGRDRLSVRGCVMGVICKSANWDRVR